VKQSPRQRGGSRDKQATVSVTTGPEANGIHGPNLQASVEEIMTEHSIQTQIQLQNPNSQSKTVNQSKIVEIVQGT